MDDFLQLINILFCGDGSPAHLPDSVLLTLFQKAGAATVSCVDPDERVQALYPRLVLSGDEGEQEQTGDADASRLRGTVRLEIVTQQSETCPDDLDLLDALKARVTDLLLGNAALELPPMQGRSFTVGGSSYNVSVFQQVRPTGRLPVSDPSMKRWGATYRVLLSRLGWNGASTSVAAFAFTPARSVQTQIDALTQQIKDLTMAFSLGQTPNPPIVLTATGSLTRPAGTQQTYQIKPTANMTSTLFTATGSGLLVNLDVSALGGFTFALALAGTDAYDGNNAAVASAIAGLIAGGAASIPLRDIGVNLWHLE